MKIAIYYPWVYLRSGCERTMAELLARSRHEWTIFTSHYEPESTFPELRSAKVVELPTVSVRRSFFHVFSAGWRIGRQKLPLEGYDALVVFCEGLGDFVCFRNDQIPLLCLCFTPLRAAFDPYYQTSYLEMNGNQFWRRALLKAVGAAYRVVDRMAWKKYSKVFAISDEVRKRISLGGLRKEDQVGLLYPGVDVDQLVPESGVYEKNFLIPGRIMWTKNLELGIDAFKLLQQRRPDLSDFTLTIAGFVDEKSKPYIARLRERAKDCPQIRFTERPSDEELFALYRSAYALIYTPFNEDWGLVPLEGMAMEKPVIAVDRGGPRETVLHGETGYLVEPTPEAFAVYMEKLATDPHLVQELGKKGRIRARSFDWKTFCEKLDDEIDETVSPAKKQMQAAECSVR